MAARASKTPKLWSKKVTEESHALVLEDGVFMKKSPRAVAESLQRLADQSRERKSSAFRSAMSMLNFYVNRAGGKLSKERKDVLERAKDELRRLYQRPSPGPRSKAVHASNAKKGSRHGSARV